MEWRAQVPEAGLRVGLDSGQRSRSRGTVIDCAQLEGLPLFAALSPAGRRVVAERATTRRFPAGTMLFAADQPSRGLFVILAGRVRVTTFRWARPHLVH